MAYQVDKDRLEEVYRIVQEEFSEEFKKQFQKEL